MKVGGTPFIAVLTCSLFMVGCRDVVDPELRRGGVVLDLVFSDPRPVSSEGTAGPVSSNRVLPSVDQVIVVLSGPIDTTVALNRTATTFEGTIDGLPTGTYSVTVVGRDAGFVTYYGRNPSVPVSGGNNTDAVVNFASFVPELDPVTAQTTQFSQLLSFSGVTSANAYSVEVARTPAFSQPVSLTTSSTTSVLPLLDVGSYYVRVRAMNGDVSASESSPSNVVSWEVVADSTSGSDAGTAVDLGLRSDAAGTYSGFNIFPVTEEDWFSLTLAAGDQLTVSVRTTSLGVPSGLDPTVRFVGPAGATLAMDDNGGEGVESLLSGTVSTAGTYNVVVASSSQGSVGHYEFDVTHFAPVASVTVDPAVATVAPAGTIQFSARTFDGVGVEVVGRGVSWRSEDVDVATVNSTGLVTGIANGIVGIVATSEGIEGRADITVSTSVLTISPDRDTLTALGNSVQLNATGGGAVLTWSTTNANIADVDANGLVTAIGNGTATITADDGNLQGSAVIVVQQTATSILTNQPIGGLAGQSMNPEPSASVVDANLNPLLNQSITFNVIAGGGDLNGAQISIVPTDQFGVARTPWTLGIPPVQMLEISAAGLLDTLSVSAYFGGQGTPFVDGIVDPGEWAGSWCITRDIDIPEGGTTPGRTCIMNDASNLYVMVRFDRTVDPNSSVTVNFDVNASGTIDPGDVYSFVVQQDDITVLEEDGHWYDNAFDPTCAVGTLCSAADSIHGGTQDGFFEGGNDGIETAFELEIPMSTGDILDIDVIPGSLIDIVAILRIWDEATGSTSSTLPTFPASGLMRVFIF